MASRRTIRLGGRRMGKTAPSFFDDGPGSPVYLMQSRVGQLLHRMRPTFPFPMSIESFLATVYPQQLFRSIPNSETVQWSNLASCMNTSPIAHFSVEGRGEHETFWVKHPAGVPLPSPSDVSATLSFDRNNPHFRVVSAWLTTALEMQFELLSVQERATNFIRVAKHPEHVEHYWPELYALVGAFLEGRVKDPAPNINTRALEIPIIRVREEITTTLAKCSLLPDIPCHAWVQYPREE